MKYLLPPHQKVLGEFINGPLWAAVKECMRDRAPEPPDTKDPSHIAAAKGHRRAQHDATIAAIEQLPFEQDETPQSPFMRPAVAITED